MTQEIDSIWIHENVALESYLQAVICSRLPYCLILLSCKISKAKLTKVEFLLWVWTIQIIPRSSWLAFSLQRCQFMDRNISNMESDKNHNNIYTSTSQFCSNGTLKHRFQYDRKNPKDRSTTSLNYLPTVIPGIHISPILEQQGNNLIKSHPTERNKKSDAERKRGNTTATES